MFKEGDKVYFIGGIDAMDPPKGIYKIIKVQNKFYYWGTKLGQYFTEKEIMPANSHIIKEKLGVK